MTKTAEEILRKYLSFENALGNGTMTTVQITIIHAMEEYAEQSMQAEIEAQEERIAFQVKANDILMETIQFNRKRIGELEQALRLHLAVSDDDPILLPQDKFNQQIQSLQSELSILDKANSEKELRIVKLEKELETKWTDEELWEMFNSYCEIDTKDMIGDTEQFFKDGFYEWLAKYKSEKGIK